MTMATDVGTAPPRAGRPLRAAAVEIRTLARGVPRWDPFDVEGWDAFERRRLVAERALAARLVRMPGCALAVSEGGWEVELTLAGIHVRSRDRLAGACIAWATRAAA